MRYIDKQGPPREFVLWKAHENEAWRASWAALEDETAIKQALHQGLLTEQGYTCAYCCKGITKERSHIEHIAPRHMTAYRLLDTEYTNLVSSCQGETDNGQPRRLQHCGHRKGRWYDAAQFVSPLDSLCEQAFQFDAGGGMSASPQAPDPDAADVTIQRLNLTSDRLREQRLAVIDLEIDRFSRVSLAPTAANLAIRIQQLQQKNTAGRLPPFGPILIDVLKQRAAMLP